MFIYHHQFITLMYLYLQLGTFVLISNVMKGSMKHPVLTCDICIVIVDYPVFVCQHLHLVFDSQMFSQIVTIPEYLSRAQLNHGNYLTGVLRKYLHLTRVLHVCGETVFMLSEVLQSCHGVGAANMKHEFDSAG